MLAAPPRSVKGIKIPPGSADFQIMKTCRGQATIQGDAHCGKSHPNARARTKLSNLGWAGGREGLQPGISFFMPASGGNIFLGFPSGIIR